MMRPLLSIVVASACAIACGKSTPPAPTAATTQPTEPATVASAPSEADASGGGETSQSPITATVEPGDITRADEPHLTAVKQLTFGGENAEAYWAFGGNELILQARIGAAECDRIYRMPLSGAGPDGSAMTQVSSGKGATTCSYFMPGDKRIVYASTHLGGDACPPRPDMSQGYVWALYDSYDIFAADADGQNIVRLTDTPGYDAEATVCSKDGSIIFTSVRDGDIDLYRMDADGKNVKRLTTGVGYDGGAFFNADCSKIVWRASRPAPGTEQDDFKKLLAQGLVRPTKLEIYVANSDGSDAVQVTYLNAASFGPYWAPSQNRIVFSSNYGDPKGREFDIWAIDIDGTDLERITAAPGFDGFPMFSPDGQWLVFASNRATAPGKHDTNVFLASWVDAGGTRIESAADGVASDVTWLADPAREGRGVGTPGLEAAGAWLEQRMSALGLKGAGDDGTFRQKFDVTTSMTSGAGTKLVLDKPVDNKAFVAMGFSPAATEAKGELIFAEYGIVAKDLGIDDYADKDVTGKVVLVRRYVPDDKELDTDAKRRHGDIRQKAWLAKERGAVALVVVDLPRAPDPVPDAWKLADETKLPALQPEGYGDAGIPVVVVTRAVAEPILAKLEKGKKVKAEVSTELAPVTSPAFNVIGRLEAKPADGKKLPGVVVVGAHYDHLGHGGRYSLAPGKEEPHVGADDNASGTAALLEAAKVLAGKADTLRHDVLFIAFSGEETGVLGSNHYTRTNMTKGQADVVAMLNMDMVGRMRDNRLQVLGADTSDGWKELVEPACKTARVDCALAGDGGLGPSDQMPFYLAGTPVLHFFTGTHLDYHKPSDTADKLSYGGLARTASIVAELAEKVAAREADLPYKAGAKGPAPRGDMRSFNASLGTIPDYAGPGEGKKGMLLAGVRPGGAAEKAGLQKGDIIIKIGAHDIGSVEDLMYVLNASKPGETTTVVVLRGEQQVSAEVTFQESTRPK